jgi:predicted HAD superfamily Cof-like phosphohydrolase
MINTRNDVRDFMVAGDQVEYGFSFQSNLYMRLITEEVIHETIKEYDLNNIVGIADGIADSIWVIEGFCISLELDLIKIWQNVKEWIDFAESEPNDVESTVCYIMEEYVKVRLEYKLQNKDYIEYSVITLLKELVILAKTLNIPLQEVWDEVSRSNMSKISENGKVIKNEFGKIQKPSTFSPADIKSILQKHNLA